MVEHDIHTDTKIHGKHNKLMAGLSVLFLTVVAWSKFIDLYNPEFAGSSLHMADVVGQITGALLLPFVVMGVFQFGKEFRNRTSRIRIVFWVSTLILFTYMVNKVFGA